MDNKGLIYKSIHGVLSLPQWYLQSLYQRDPNIWVFGSWFGNRYSDNSKAMFEYVNMHAPLICAVWITKDANIKKRLNTQGMKCELISSRKGKNIVRHAGTAFINNGMEDIGGEYLHGATIINLWHGMPIKQVCADAMAFFREETVWKKIKTTIRKHLTPWEFLSFKIIALGDIHVPHLQSAFELERSEIWCLGSPRTDKFFQSQTEHLIEQIRIKYSNPKIIFYLPTFRDNKTNNKQVYNPFELADFNSTKLEQVLQRKNMVFLYKGHYCDTMSRGFAGQRILTIDDSSYSDMYSFIRDVDVLITDYSSIYFDYLFLKRPIILFPYDLDEYISSSRPLYFDYNILEGKRVYSWNKLTEALEKDDYYVPSQKTRDTFLLYQDGLSCQRIYNHVVVK